MDARDYIINDKLLCIPPFISTSWMSVLSIHMQEGDLAISLKEGTTIRLKNLPEDITKKIFISHAQHLKIDAELNQMSKETKSGPSLPKPLAALTDPTFSNDQIFRIGIGSIEEMGSVMQHNSNQKDGPNLPKELLQRIASVIKMIAPPDPDLLPKAEPHCNCMHCQIARSILDQEPSQESVATTEAVEEIVTDEELVFTQFVITPCGDNLYSVYDKLSPSERFTVFLGETVGCTCGKHGCEHLLAVLNS